MGIFSNSNNQALVQNSLYYRVSSYLSVLYLLIFPFSSTMLPFVSGAIVSLIVLNSQLLYLFPISENKKFNHEERLFYISVSFMVIVAVMATAFAGIDYLGMKKLGKFVYLLMVIPVYLYFKTVRINQSWVWYGLAIGAFCSAVLGLYEVANEIHKPGYFGRAKGATHPIIFGDLALIMGGLAMAGWSWFRGKPRWQMLIPVGALFAGILASILSQSRGGWVAIPFIIATILWGSRAYVSTRKQLAAVLIIICALGLAYLTPQTGVKTKIETTFTNVDRYFDDGVAGRFHRTSIGSRIEMWQASWSIFLENPIFGVGWGNYQKNALQLVDQGERNKSAGEWSHPHNQFLSAMVNGGVFSLTAIIFLFLVPSRIFYKVCKSSSRTIDAQRMALAGLVLMVGFAIFNFSETFLERSRTVSFFIFYLAVFMAGIREKN